MASQQGHSEIQPTTILRHVYAVYPPIAMLAGMQLDVFTPLKDGPMSAMAIAKAIGVRPEKLQLLLYALVHAELLTVEGDRFVNTAEADRYLVRGRPAYMGGAHELYSDLWSAAFRAAQSIRAGAPQAKHDFTAMPDEELGAFFRGLHPGALANGRLLIDSYGLRRYRNLLDVGGGSGGLAIAACQGCPDLRATVAELPRVASITRPFVEEAGLTDRVQVLVADLVERSPEGHFDVAVLRNLIQVLAPYQARRLLRNVSEAMEPGGTILILGHVLEDNHLSPTQSVGLNLAFLSIYDEGQAYTEGQHRLWLAEAGFSDIETQYGAAGGVLSVISARKNS